MRSFSFLLSLATLPTLLLLSSAPASARSAQPALTAAPTPGFQYLRGAPMTLQGTQTVSVSAESGLIEAGGMGGNGDSTGDPPGESMADTEDWYIEEDVELDTDGGQLTATPGAPLTANAVASFSDDCGSGEAQADVGSIPTYRLLASRGGIGASYIHQGMEPLDAAISLDPYDMSCYGHSAATTYNRVEDPVEGLVPFVITQPTYVFVFAELLTEGESEAEDASIVRASGSWQISGPVSAGCTLSLDSHYEEGCSGGGPDDDDADDEDLGDDDAPDTIGDDEDEDEDEGDDGGYVRTIRTACAEAVLLVPGEYTFRTTYQHHTSQAVYAPSDVQAAMLMHQEAFTVNARVLGQKLGTSSRR